jgi:hypothetical protein
MMLKAAAESLSSTRLSYIHAEITLPYAIDTVRSWQAAETLKFVRDRAGLYAASVKRPL